MSAQPVQIRTSDLDSQNEVEDRDSGFRRFGSKIEASMSSFLDRMRTRRSESLRSTDHATARKRS